MVRSHEGRRGAKVAEPAEEEDVLKDHYCGELRSEHAGERVTLAGWVHRRRDHGGLIFVDLRDSRGLVQVVINPSQAPEAHKIGSELRNEFVIQVSGTVDLRREGTQNPDLPTGQIEVQADEVSILNRSLTPPFYVNEDSDVDELLRIRYRYVDLRRMTMQQNIQLRHRVALFMREFLNANGFTEIETPVLIKSTPEGARDYLVPSRVHPGNFYALPQSPQQLKQLLMVAGFERYFQIAHCFRDEDLRADRQPEFTQLDLEMSFVEQEDILDLIEELYTEMVAKLTPHYNVPSPWPRITYQEAMERYGSDKPDLRYGLELRDFSDLFASTEFNVFKSALSSGGRIRGFAVPGGAGFPRRGIDALTDLAKTGGARGLVPIAIQGEGTLDSITDDDVRSPVKQFLPLETVKAVAKRAEAKPGDLILIVADKDGVSNRTLDLLRRDIAERQGLIDANTLAFLWVVDFPLFEWDEAGQRWDSAHHPFTSPKSEDRHLLDTEPGRVRSNAYDIVCNGWEIGSGSIRIHERDVQSKIFSLLGISEEEQKDRFGHMLEAFEYGAPPHGGIAPGLDRTVALLAGERDIREVIAFPKTKSATDPMTGAPSPVDERQLADLGLLLRQPPETRQASS